MKKQIAVGLDVGTSSLKAAAADLSTGEIILTYHHDYENLRFYAPGVSYAEDYVKNIIYVLNKLSEEYQIAGISIDTQMYSVCQKVGEETVVYQWNCVWNRDREMEAVMKEHLIASGCQNDTIFGAYKAATAPKDPDKPFYPYDLKAYLFRALTGRLATDYATAASTGFFLAREKTWNEPFMKLAGVDFSQLPDLLLPNDKVGMLKEGLFPGSEAAIAATGLGDGAAASYACKHLSNFCGNLGTSMAARVFTKTPDISEKGGMWNYAVDHEYYLAGGISSNGCSVIDWAKREHLLNDDGVLESNNIRFFPWLHGERMPYWSSDMEGIFTGIHITDGQQNISAAVVKGVAFSYATMVRSLEKLSDCSDALILAGGGINRKEMVDVIAGCIESKIWILEDADYLSAIGSVVCIMECLNKEIRLSSEIAREIPPTGKFKEEYLQWKEMADRIAQLMHEEK